MKLYFQQERSNLPLERYKYSVEQAMLSLFPGEKPVYVSGPLSETDSGPWAELVMNQEGDRLHVQVGLCVQGNSAVQSLGESLSGTEFEREGQRRRAVVRCGETDLAMKSTGADGEELLIGLLMELAVKKGA